MPPPGRTGTIRKDARPTTGGTAGSSSTAKKTGTAKKATKTISGKTARKAPIPVVKRRRVKPGTKALREIRRLQKSTDLIFPKLPFYRLIREITQDFEPANHEGYRFQASALQAIQEAAEQFLLLQFETANAISQFAKRVTVMPRDMRLYRTLLCMTRGYAIHPGEPRSIHDSGPPILVAPAPPAKKTVTKPKATKTSKTSASIAVVVPTKKRRRPVVDDSDDSDDNDELAAHIHSTKKTKTAAKKTKTTAVISSSSDDTPDDDMGEAPEDEDDDSGEKDDDEGGEEDEGEKDGGEDDESGDDDESPGGGTGKPSGGEDELPSDDDIPHDIGPDLEPDDGPADPEPEDAPVTPADTTSKPFIDPDIAAAFAAVPGDHSGVLSYISAATALLGSSFKLPDFMTASGSKVTKPAAESDHDPDSRPVTA